MPVGFKTEDLPGPSTQKLAKTSEGQMLLFEMTSSSYRQIGLRYWKGKESPSVRGENFG